MKAKSVGNKLAGVTTILEVPTEKKAKLLSLYLSNIDVNPASVDVYILKDGSVDNIYLIKDALVPIQSALQVISNEVIMEQGDQLIVNPSHANRIDSTLSYFEIQIRSGFY